MLLKCCRLFVSIFNFAKELIVIVYCCWLLPYAAWWWLTTGLWPVAVGVTQAAVTSWHVRSRTHTGSHWDAHYTRTLGLQYRVSALTYVELWTDHGLQVARSGNDLFNGSATVITVLNAPRRDGNPGFWPAYKGLFDYRIQIMIHNESRFIFTWQIEWL